MNLLNWMKLAALAILWGMSFVFVGLALEGFGPLSLVLVRVGLGALVLWGVIFIRGGEVPRRWGEWMPYFVMGLLANVLPFVLISWGQKTITAGMASMLNATVPMFTVLLLAAGGKCDDWKRKFLGVLVGFLGVAFLLSAHHISFEGSILGKLMVLGAALCYAGGSLFGQRFSGRVPMVNAAMMLSCSTVMLAPWAFLVESPFSAMAPGMVSWLGVIALGVFCTAVAYLLYFSILKSEGATQLSLVTYLIPIVSTIFGFLILGEEVGTREILAMCVVFAGLLIVDPGLLVRAKACVGISRKESRNFANGEISRVGRGGGDRAQMPDKQ